MFSWIMRLLSCARKHGRREHQSVASVTDEVKVVSAERLPRVTTSGMQVVAMTGDYDRSRLPATNGQIVLADSSGSSVTARCGHSSREELVLDVYGVKISGDGRLFCPDCSREELGRITIRCALCELPILPGDAVSIYDIGGADIKPAIAYRVGEEQVLGCVRMDCSLPGAFAGHWGGPNKGFLSAFSS